MSAENGVFTKTEMIKSYISEYPDTSNRELAKKIKQEKRLDYSYDTLRMMIGKIKSDSNSVQIEANEEKLKCWVSSGQYKFNTRRGEFQLSVEQVDNLFYEYSEHGLNKTQTEIINKYGLKVWEWNAIKNSLFLFKKSNIFSPYTMENTPKQDLEAVISEKIEHALHDKLNVEHLYKKSVIKNAKKAIDSQNRKELAEQTFLSELADELQKIKFTGAMPVKRNATNKPINVFLSDLHNGARIEWLHLTPEYNPEILREIMDDIAKEINSLNSTEVTLSFLGDLIESFTGLNHKTSWQEMEGGYYGAYVVKNTLELLENFICKINNVKSIVGIGGNHDRGDSDASVDYQGEIAGIIFYILKRVLPKSITVYYDNRLVSTHVDGIQYVVMHGHHGEAKRNSSEIVLNHGKQGIYNLIVTGHTHSLAVKSDNNLHRHIVCPPLFPGNSYSEQLGFSSTQGFLVSQNNGKGKPTITVYSV